MNDVRPSPRRTRFGCILLVLLAPLLLMIILVNLPPMADTTTQQDAQSEFTNETGFAWPEEATVVSFGDGHGTIPLSSEGEFYLVFETDSDTIDKFLQAQPKAPLSDWQSGPVPAEIGFHCRFGTDGVSASIENGGPSHYSGNPELVDVLGSKDIKNCAHERCCNSLAWHNGTLLVVAPPQQKSLALEVGFLMEVEQTADDAAENANGRMLVALLRVIRVFRGPLTPGSQLSQRKRPILQFEIVFFV